MSPPGLGASSHVFYDHVTLHSPCSQLPSSADPLLAPQLSRVGLVPLSAPTPPLHPTLPPWPPRAHGSLSRPLLISYKMCSMISLTSLLLPYGGSLVENPRWHPRGPQWLCVPSPPAPSPSRWLPLSAGYLLSLARQGQEQAALKLMVLKCRYFKLLQYPERQMPTMSPGI